MLHVKINGKDFDFSEGLSILQALHSLQLEIPQLCHDERLKPYGGCRLCVVHIEGYSRPQTACDTLLQEGMRIETHSDEIEALRRTNLKLLAGSYPMEAVKEFPEKEFHRYLRTYGLDKHLDGKSPASLRDDSHPFLHVNMSQCIYCYRCVRICDEVQGQFVWKVWNRGDSTRIRPDSGTNLLESSCVSCGACVDTCPSGALLDQTILKRGEPDTWIKTVCPYCGVGCEMEVGKKHEEIVAIRPSLESPVNKGHLCVKGRYAFDFIKSGDRITQPMIRNNGDWRRVSWEKALAFTAEGLKRIQEHHGPDSLAVLGSARATNEENYLAQKFARLVLGTHNIDCCARVCHTPTAAAMKLMLGTGASTNSFDDIEIAQSILVCGSNTTENHPVVGARIKQQAMKGIPLIVIDPRRIELVEYAAIHLALKPGTNVPLLNAMAATILEEGLSDEEFLRQRVSDLEGYRDFLNNFTPEKIAGLCGVDAGQIRAAARIYATRKPAMCLHGLGITEHVQGTEGVMCLVNLALLTGNLGKPGSGINPLRGQNNVQGAAHMGCDPSILTGSISLKDGKDHFEKVWGCPLPIKKGLNLLQMMDAAAKGTLKALYVIGYDVFLTNADACSTREAMKNLDLVIVQDLFLTETAKEFGSIFLPAASSFEKDGTFMNAERRIQRVRKVLEPAGDSKSDWEILCHLAQRMGKERYFSFRSPEEIWNEIRQVWPAGSGITYERIERAGLQWPCPSLDHPGTQMLHSENFASGKTAQLRKIPFRPSPEVTNADFPFLLNTGRNLYHFNAGTMSARTKMLELKPTDRLRISPEDAERLNFKDGIKVRIVSRYGEVILPLQIHSEVKTGELFSTFHTAEIFLNKVTGPHRDRYVQTPEYKITAVRIESV